MEPVPSARGAWRARAQYSALAAMRWQMFRNSLRTNQGVFELGARTFSYFIYACMGVGLSVGLGIGAYAMVSSGKLNYLPFLFWAVFLIWQILPVALASFQEQFDLGILLRFPLGFTSYILLYLIFGLVDISTITGALCGLGLWVGITVARPDLSGIAALSLTVFAGFNILLVRAIFAWIDRWLAQRRTREIVGAIFLLLLLSLQLLNPALHNTEITAQSDDRGHNADPAQRPRNTSGRRLISRRDAAVAGHGQPNTALAAAGFGGEGDGDSALAAKVVGNRFVGGRVDRAAGGARSAGDCIGAAPVECWPRGSRAEYRGEELAAARDEDS